MKTFITYYFYPLLLVILSIICYLALTRGWDLVLTYSIIGGVRFPTLLLIEFLFPMNKKWKMDWSSFVRDLKYLGLGFIVLKVGKYVIGIALIYWSSNNEGLIANASIFFGFLITALTFEFLQYWYHRLSHETKGKVGDFLWKIHVAHHLPKKVYVLMHGVFHPLNAFITLAIIQGTLVILGARSESIFLLQVFMSLQGQISHFNVRIKAGYFNYLFIGTELHRNHHSANIEEAKNYGAFLSIWDIIFGTFYYNPNKEPEALGVSDPNIYPESTKILDVILLPFKKTKK